MFSVKSCSPNVMKILVPKILKVPSGCGSARVLTSARIGARLRFGQVHGAGPLTTHHLFRNKGGLSSSEPASSSASMAPCVSIGNKPKLMFDECTISSVSVISERGMPNRQTPRHRQRRAAHGAIRVVRL